MPARRPPERRLVGTALLSLLRELATTPGGVALAVDDLQWLDAPSAAAIGFALRRLGPEPVRALLAVRSGEAERSLVAELGHDERLVRVELGPLSVAALHRILSQELGRTFPRPTLVRIGQLSDGNALYALEIARRLEQEDGHDLTELPVPESLQTLVAARVHALPAETRAALLRAAALARPDLRLVEAAALAPAEEAGLVRIAAGDRVEFAHPLFASAVYSSTPLARRREAHRELAAAVADPDEIVRHLALACDGPDDGGGRGARDAARRARARGAPETAAELAQLALRLLPEDDAARDELRLEVAGYLSFAGDFQRARRLLEELRGDLEPGDLLARALLTLAEIDYWRRGESAALALGEEALRRRRATRWSRPAATSRSRWTRARSTSPKAAAAARAALGAARAPGPTPSRACVSAALGARVRADLFLGEGFDVEAAERALALEGNARAGAVDTRAASSSASGCGTSTTSTARGRGSPRPSARRSRRATSRRSRTSCSIASSLETWAGNWSEAAELTGRMNDAFEQLGTEPSGIGPWLVYVDAHAGRLEPVQAAGGARPADASRSSPQSRPLPRPRRARRRRPRGRRPRPLGRAGRARPGGLSRAGGLAGRRRRDRGGGRRRRSRRGPRRSCLASRSAPRARGSRGASPSRPAAAACVCAAGGELEDAAGRARPRAGRARALPGAVRARADAARPGAGPPPPEAEARGPGRAGRGAGDLPTARRGGMGAAGRGRARPGRRPPGAGRAERDRAADRHASPPPA